MVAVTTPTTDAQLVAQALRGNTKAFGELVCRHTPALYGLCLRLLRDPTDAEDMVQDACVKALRKLDRLAEPRRFRSWLFRIGQNLCFDRLRSRRSWQPLNGAEEAASGDKPMFAVDTVALGRALEILTPKQRALVHYRYTLGWRTPEIAVQLKLTPSNVRVSLHRAIRKLRERLS